MDPVKTSSHQPQNSSESSRVDVDYRPQYSSHRPQNNSESSHIDYQPQYSSYQNSFPQLQNRPYDSHLGSDSAYDLDDSTHSSADSGPDLSPDSLALSDLESSAAGSGYERYCNAIEIDDDIVSTHKTNEELRERNAVKQFFKEVGNMNTLKDNEKREWIGSLPSKMFKEAIPLFTDFNTGMDYQLHISYTRMKGLHTYTHYAAENRNDNIPDYYVHSLLHVTNRNEMELVSKPNIVIPLGKLFVNESGRSHWTGYEVFVSSNMELWIIYAVDENDVEKWDLVDCSLWSRKAISDSAKNKQTEKASNFKIARLWNSITTLHSMSFKEAVDMLEFSGSKNYTGSFLLLEISISEVSRVISLSNKHVHKILETRKSE